MNSNLKLLPAALLVAVLAMAGCGGGGGDDTMPTEPTEPTEPAPPASVEQLSLDIQAAENDAMAANEMAATALKNAMKYDDMLSTTEVAGDSGKAMMAAQAILKAEMDVGTALMNAEDALEAAEAAKMAVMALADDHPHKATLMSSVDRAVMNAEMYVAAIKAISTGVDLEAAVLAVEGTNGKGTPRSIANSVGNALATALALADTPSGTNLSRAVGTHYTGATEFDAFTTAALKHGADNARGHTWEEIVKNNGGSIVTMPLGTAETAGNAALKVASIAGMAASDVWNDPANIPAEDARVDGGLFATGADYMGIPGSVFCLGSDCKITDGKLAGSWYFAVATASANVHYVRNTDNTTRTVSPYVAEGQYARYGHWLVIDGTSGAVTANSFAAIGGNTTNSAFSTAAASTLEGIDDGDKASYSGDAAGVSVLKKGTGDAATTDSGRFTASVKLNASFGPTAMATGTINNFVGSAVNPAWSVTLGDAPLDASATGAAISGGRDGLWNATAYGTGVTGGDAVRPAGIYGGFSVHFPDGDAAGAYATTKD